MKKLMLVVALIIIVLVIGLGFKKDPAPLASDDALDRSKEQCFTRSIAATPEAPYAVEEQIALTIEGAAVTGTKSGTQAGPGMTNGYEGALSGTKAGDRLSLLFSYVIEGSAQSEREEYVLSETALTKHRYPLVERAGILMPDTAQSFTSQIYDREPCPIS